MIVDICENENGQKAFLLAQGYMPAQEFHILKNPKHESDPWYYENEVVYPFTTPQYTFEEGSLRHLKYWKWLSIFLFFLYTYNNGGIYDEKKYNRIS